MATDRSRPDAAPPAAATTSAAPAEVEPAPARALVGRIWIKLLISLVIAAAFVWTLRRGGLPLLPPREALARVDLAGCLLYLPALVTWQFIRAARWRHLLRTLDPGLSLGRAAAVSFIGYGAILILPLRAGELIRPYLIRDKERISMSAALGIIGAERIIDGLLLTGLLGICLQVSNLLHPLPDHIGKLAIPVAAVPIYAYTALVAFLGAFVLMVLFHLRPALARVLVQATFGLVSDRLAARVLGVVGRMAEGLVFLRRPRHVGPFLLETVIYWIVNALGILLLARAVGLPSFSLAQAVVVMGVLSIGVVIPAGPGLFGAFQASIYAGLALYYRDDVVLGAGAAFVFLLYVLEGSWQLLAAAVSLWRERRLRRAIFPSR